MPSVRGGESLETLPPTETPRSAPAAKVDAPQLKEPSVVSSSEPRQAVVPTANPTPRESSAAVSNTATKLDKVGVVICAMGDEPIEPTVKSIDEKLFVVVVLASDRESIPNDNWGNQIVTVQLSDAEATAGRARNAGYRALKKVLPDLVYVQFIDAGQAIAPDWLGTAARHMDRRPELSAVEGKKEARIIGGTAPRAKQLKSTILPAGEVQTCKATAMFRAQAFEAAGGFRGDIAVNETEDLCIRLRRRGGHIWRIEPQMSVYEATKKGFSGWWSEAQQMGYSHAVGAALHGGPPERFRVTEQARAVMWGLVFPVFVLFAALISYLGAMFFSVGTEPALAALVVLVASIGIYFIKIALAAFKDGPFALSSRGESIATTLAHIPEFMGIAHYWAAGRKSKRVSKRA